MDIEYLADHPHVIPTMAEWFFHEWSYLYPERTLQEVERAMRTWTNRDCIPVAVVAFEAGELVGTVCLKAHDMDTRKALSPWLAGLYVAAPWRHKGIGTQLVAAIEQKAVTLGIRELYLYTPESAFFYAQLGWAIKEETVYHQCHVTVMHKNLV